MPRWACRPGFTRRVTDVRIERVQATSVEDMLAEGLGLFCQPEWCSVETIPPPRTPEGYIQGPQRGSEEERVAFCVAQNTIVFRDSWDSRYAGTPFAWGENPLVWVGTLEPKGA